MCTLPPCTHFSLVPESFTFEDLPPANLLSSSNQSIAEESTQSQTRESNSSTANKIQINEWVIVAIGGVWQAGIVQEMSGTEISVNCMRRTGKKLKWPKKPDLQSILMENIICLPTSSPIVDLKAKSKDVFLFEDQQYKLITQQTKQHKISQ